jgi:hypothetical protein
LLSIPTDLLCQIAHVVDPTSSTRYEELLGCLDSRFFTPQARYNAESSYYLCKIIARGTLPAFVNRFNQVVHNFKLATARTLSDMDKIHGLSAGLHGTPNAKIAGLLQHLSDCKKFINFTERLRGLYDVAGHPDSELAAIQVVDSDPTPADLAAADAKRKRDDTESHYTPANGHSFRFIRGGCARCKEATHIAAECKNNVKDFERRCRRCGSHKHSEPDCKAPLKRQCKRCSGSHYDQICPNPLNTSLNSSRNRPTMSNNAISTTPAPESVKISEMSKDMGKAVMECNATNSASGTPAFTADV